MQDSNNHRVKQFKDIPLTKGVYSGKFKLSPETNVGLWLIKVFIGGKYNQEKSASFQIEKYVLPKFETHIETNKDFVIADQFIKVNVYAKYTYNKYVEGIAQLQIISSRTVLYNQTKNIENFMAKFEIDFESLLRDNLALMGNQLFLKATVVEKQTGITHNATTIVNLQTERYQIIILDDKIEFRNGVPYRIKVKVQHWNNSIVVDELTPVSMEYQNKVYKSKLDTSGIATFEYHYYEWSSFLFRYKDSMAQIPPFVEYKRTAKEKTECNLSLKTER